MADLDPVAGLGNLARAAPGVGGMTLEEALGKLAAGMGEIVRLLAEQNRPVRAHTYVLELDTTWRKIVEANSKRVKMAFFLAGLAPADTQGGYISPYEPTEKPATIVGWSAIPLFSQFGTGANGPTVLPFVDNPPCHKGEWYGFWAGGPKALVVVEWIRE